MELWKYCSDDYEKVIALFYDTIHAINSADYTKNQLNAWAPDVQMIQSENWFGDRFLRDHTVVAKEDGVIIGFGNGDENGHLDCLYVHKDFQKMGVATLIADDIESYARCNGAQFMTTDASITALPFFEKRGYLVQLKQDVWRKGQLLTNFKMRKQLDK